MSAPNIEIKLNKFDKVYYEGELLAGTISINCPAEVRHEGLILSFEGAVNLQVNNKHGIFENFYNSMKPITLINSTLELSAAGKLPQGLSEFHFEHLLICQKDPKVLYETYHGVFININYQLKCELKRSFLAKTITKCQQFCIRRKNNETIENKSIEDKTKPAKKDEEQEINFKISPESLQKYKEKISIPKFLITGKLNHVTCSIEKPLSGYLILQHTESAIKGIELQLVRVETVGCEEGFSKDVTEIQTIQIAAGNICPQIKIPIYMIFPRLFTCPTLTTKNFKIEFEINLLIIFGDGNIITENFPIILKRTS